MDNLEQSRMEIVLLAAGVLVLVSVLAVLVLICVALKHSKGPPRQHNSTAWGGSWSERWDAGPPTSYRDEAFDNNVRQPSVSITDDIRRELASLRQIVTLTEPNRGSFPVQDNTDPVPSRSDTTNGKTNNQLIEHSVDCDGTSWCDTQDSRASSTAREQESDTVIKRPERTVDHGETFDLEAQDSADSDS
ncbi:uncharacterized protein UV8b_03503 [Ustilaginoidea virens]|uniref:Uncharacterized protein n=1 Tax=Ustilaginoidea virens TaxID=1159556 RepID=A0A063C525_USTVR|nr:uncharacterized protein UV8b_03503 [Ustilaginoidea virens]QUC19262.1 hypothetical protein UV8b_03503 [Ustilaginoidea virens]GAO13114.1 hypothetical protein UVI_02024730 [Ustilaginoidea virens]